MNDSDSVEIINEDEISLLLQHHSINNSFVGFYYGLTERNIEELIYFPGLCHNCQKVEVGNWK